MLQAILSRFKGRFVIRRYEIILLGSVLLLSGAVIPSSWEPPMPIPQRPSDDLPPKHPWIALTFDDGPHPIMTERLLQVLQEEHVPGTFFIVGKMAARYPLLVQEIARQGNELANHTYNHYRLTRLDNAKVLDELDQTREVIRRITGQDTILFRPPGGDYTRRMLRATTKAGYRMVLWTTLTNDFRGVSSRVIYRRVMDGAQDGGIILMHSGMKNTVDVLPEVIAKLRQRGYHFVTVSQLMGLPAPSLRPAAPALVTADSRAADGGGIRTR